jgi:hypothetical protein
MFVYAAVYAAYLCFIKPQAGLKLDYFAAYNAA